MNLMFQSARFKLTLFYLAIILTLSLTLSFGTRWIAQHEFERGNVAQQWAFRGVIHRTLGFTEVEIPARAFGFQDRQEERLRKKLNTYVLLVNIGALIVGGLASYIFAGWTLRPIEEAHEAQRRFASDASHELRTPLTVIKTENEVFLRQKDFAKADARALIESNLEEVDRLERLAVNLLALTEYEDASLPLVAVPIQDVVAEASQQLARTRSNLPVVNRSKPATVRGHHESLVQLLGIVLDNAAKYSPKNQPITITSTATDSEYMLHIADKGKGIADEDLPYIFDRLYRGDKARSSSVPGHGLGLALAKRIAKANGGDITAANHPKDGAVFTVTLQKA